MTQAVLSKSVSLGSSLSGSSLHGDVCLRGMKSASFLEAHATHGPQLVALSLAYLPSSALGLLCAFQLTDSPKFPSESQTTEEPWSPVTKRYNGCAPLSCVLTPKRELKQ